MSTETFKSEDVYIVGIHRYNFRAGEPGLIIGVKMITLENTPPFSDKLEPRLCYEIKYSDGVIDYTPIKETTHRIITFDDILHGRVPKITE